MYTKKVMQHFKHPKNMGKIKNPDGTGKVGNPICLSLGSKIQTNPLLIPIEVIDLNSKTLGHDGKFHKVNKIFIRNYNNNLIKIKSRLGETKLTPDHMVRAIKVPKGDKFLRIENKKKLIADWYNSKDLNKNDILLYPISKEVIDVKKINIETPHFKYDFRSKEISKTINVNKEFLRLSGYFIAEGDTRLKISKVATTFTFGYNENEYVNDTVNLINKIFNLESKVKKIKCRNTILITISNVHLTRFFNKLFGKGSKNKAIPEFMLFLPVEKQKELIKGLWRGDGFVNTKIPRAGFSTVSYKLVQQLKFLLIRQGIIPSIYTEKEKIKNGVNHKECYRINVGSWSTRKLADILNVNIDKRKLSNDSWADRNYIYFPITSINKEFYNDKVYNLEVNDSHSFSTDSALVHNCGDVMWLYLKIKGEKITNIKFETFGCVAAISTSSMITELVKGKTIDFALTLTKENILKRLGGLPPIKIHCSVLAIDALHAALYDYLTKNNLPIPDKLKNISTKINNHEH